jgi:hypothetical protein
MKAANVLYLLQTHAQEHIGDDLAEWVATYRGDERESKAFRTQRERRRMLSYVIAELDLWPERQVSISPGLVRTIRQCRQKVCAICGQSFRSVRADARTCSPKCRVSRNRRKNASQGPPTNTR